MNEVKWIKLWVDMFDNIKIRKLNKLPNALGDTIKAIWFEILALAGKVNESGYLFYIKRGQQIPYDIKRLSEDLDRDEKQIQVALDYFLDNNMVGMMDDTYMIANWTTYQDNDALQRLKDKEYHKNYMANRRSKEIPLDTTITTPQTPIEMPPTTQNKPTTAFSNKPSINTLNEEFKQLWALYPNKKGKEKSLEKYIKYRLDGVSYEEVLQGIENYNKEIEAKHTPMNYIKMASTWFNQKCWEDTYDYTPITYSNGKKSIKPTTDWTNDYIKDVKEQSEINKSIKSDKDINEMLKDFEERK
jgi:predicted phage replisome organizer